MKAVAARVGALLLVAAFAASCISAFTAVTPAQRAYAAISEYGLVLDAAVAYAESPVARPEVVRQLVSIDRQAQAVIVRIRNVVAMAETLSEPSANELSDLTRILKFFQAATSEELLGAVAP